MTLKLTDEGGRGVGGSTLVNGLTYGRGSSSIYDLWSSLGNNGWDWKSVLSYSVKVRNQMPAGSSRLTTSEEHFFCSEPHRTFPNVRCSAYSTNGPITLSYPDYAYDVSTAFIKALGAVNTPMVKALNLGDNIGAKQEPLVQTRSVTART